MTEPVLLPELDEPPKNGIYAPELSELDLTPEEVAEGNALGAWTDGIPSREA